MPLLKYCGWYRLPRGPLSQPLPLVGSGAGVVDPFDDAGIHDEQRLCRHCDLDDVPPGRLGSGPNARIHSRLRERTADAVAGEARDLLDGNHALPGQITKGSVVPAEPVTERGEFLLQCEHL